LACEQPSESVKVGHLSQLEQSGSVGKDVLVVDLVALAVRLSVSSMVQSQYLHWASLVPGLWVSESSQSAPIH
jgi:hypothetical protein